jgi:secondary thiamine-phosphate synthase enzyme
MDRIKNVHLLKVRTTKEPEFIDITEEIINLIIESGVNDGFVLVYSKHTTAAIKINENEPLLLKDMEEFLKRIAPKDANYHHNDFAVRTVNMNEDECPNGHAHCAHLLLSTSESIPIINSKIALGQWQRIFFVELDSGFAKNGREREVLVQIIGD